MNALSTPLTVDGRYQAALKSGTLQPDAAQQNAVRVLDGLYKNITAQQKGGFWAKLFKPKPAAVAQHQGAYLYGPVGRGKSMLMQFFLDALTQWNQHPATRRPIRVERHHFHAFMLDLHAQLHRVKVTPDRMDNRLSELADELADRLDVLCFDEFHVTDVADAMLLMPYFTRLIERQVWIVATSNFAPPDLYKNGLQRQRFLPFIALLQTHLNCIQVGGPQDYRLLQWQNNSLKQDHWLTPLDGSTATQFADVFASLAGYDTVAAHSLEIKDQNRVFNIARATQRVAMLTVNQVTTGAVGAADFLALGSAFKLVMLDNVQPFQANENDKAKRFMLLVDTLYEAGTHLFVRAAVEPTDLYPATGSLGFEFARTVSRLQEMRYRAISL